MEKKEIQSEQQQELEREDGDFQESTNISTTNSNGRVIPPWTRQITVRGIFVSIVIGVIYSVIAMKLNLTTGLVPNLNVSAALLAFVFIRTWTMTLQKAGYVATPFTRQENTMIQTCAVACYSIAVSGSLIITLRITFCREVYKA
ncbi:hypothetical protein ACFE04_014697 [Oxalis oulophora]